MRTARWFLAAVAVAGACSRETPSSVDPSSTTRPTLTTSTGPTTTDEPPLLDRIAFVGDSLGDNLGAGLAAAAAPYGVEVVNDAISGCGVAPSGDYRFGVQTHGLSEVCVAWAPTWEERLRRDRPKVVAIQVGRHEVVDRVFDGRWTNILDPAYAGYVREELRHAVAIAGARGARVVLLTAPRFRASSAPRPEDDPARVDRFNELLAEVAAADPRAVVIDLGGRVSPGGAFATVVEGVRVRSDGVHFSPEGVAWIGPWLLPQLAALVRSVDS